MKAFESINKETEMLAEGSVNKGRLHGQVYMQLIIRVKDLVKFSDDDYKRILDYIYKTELNAEIIRMRIEHNETGLPKLCEFFRFTEIEKTIE